MNQNKIMQMLGKISTYFFLYAVTTAIFLSLFLLTPESDHTYPILRSFIIFFSTILLVKYFFYMIVSPWYDVYTARVSKKNRITSESYEPLVSILIPAWNESCGVVRTIETILDSTYNRIELVVVNDGSTDDSHNLINEFIKKKKIHNHNTPSFPIIYTYQKNTGKGGALNKAINASHGDILLTIDADCVITPTTVENFVRHFEDQNVMAAVGNVKVGNTEHLLGVVQQLEFLFSFYFKRADSMMNTIYIIGGAAGAFRREIFDIVGVFDTSNITEDIDLSVRIQKSGAKIVYASDAIVYTEGASDFKGLLKQRLRWKRGRFETFIKHYELFFSRQSKHKKMLSWIVLPFALLAEFQLSFELLFLAFLYIYSYLTNDFSSFIPGIAIVASMFFVQILFTRTEKRSWSLYLLAPIGWLLFYLTTIVEVMALVSSVSGLVRKKEVKWQKWERVGLKQ